jgi:hypothetical protein
MLTEGIQAKGQAGAKQARDVLEVLAESLEAPAEGGNQDSEP